MAEKKICRKGFEIQVLSSGAGYYIGTFDPKEGPNCRISKDYWKKKEDAVKALESMSFVDRSYAIENEFCHEGRGCLENEEQDDGLDPDYWWRLAQQNE